jgi:hypothetical protein
MALLSCGLLLRLVSFDLEGCAAVPGACGLWFRRFIDLAEAITPELAPPLSSQAITILVARALFMVQR